MSNLDDPKYHEKHDPDGMRLRIAELPDQIDKAVAAFADISVPTHYVQAKNVIILGMGGSAIGGELAAALAAVDNPLPVEIRRDYELPGFVGKDTLVIGVSYSGNTEETLSGFRLAAARGAKLIAVATDGELAALGRKFKVPMFPIDYASVPRAALGYLFTATAMIFHKLRLHALGPNELTETSVLLRALNGKLAPEVPTTENLAKTLALKLRDKLPLVIGAGPMATVAKRWKTQFNENSKLAVFADALPELCHNTIVGMERVWRQRDALAPIFLDSAFAHPRNQLRMTIVRRIFTHQKLPVENIVIHPTGTALSEALQMVMLGDYVTYYTAMLAPVDPTVILPIEQLKKELAQHPLENDK